jgi:hypothetical protein
MKKLFLIYTLFLVILVLVCSPIYAATVEVSWNANPETDIAGYVVGYGTTDGSYDKTVQVGNVTTTDITISPPTKTRYYFAVKAFNTSGLYSVWSDSFALDVPTSTPPSKPGGIGAKIKQLLSWLMSIFGGSA